MLSGSQPGRLGDWRKLLPWRASRYVSSRFNALSRRLDALERLAEGSPAVYVGNNRLLTRCVVAGRMIAFYVQADDRLLTPWFVVTGQYETPITDYFARSLRADSHCIDIGANFGYYSCLMARFSPAGRMLGVEPEPETFGLLRDNLAINNLVGHATALQAAVTESGNPIVLHKRVSRAGNTSAVVPDAGFLTAMGEEPSVPFEVAGATLDALAERIDGRVDVVKIDVEGLEAAVLRGGAGAIAANPQINIVMEWSPGQMAGVGSSDREALDAIRSLGLETRDLVDRPGARLTDAQLLDGQFRTGILLSGKSARHG